MSLPVPPNITQGQIALDPVNGVVYYKDDNGDLVATTWSWLRDDIANISTDDEVLIDADLTVAGDLIIQGDTVSLNVAQVLIEDNILVLNSNYTEAPVLNAGIEVERGSEPNVLIRWNELDNKWQFTNDGTTYLDLNSIIENSVTLGLHTVGEYVKNITAGTGVSVTMPSGEGATPTISIGQDVSTEATPNFARVIAPLTGNVTGNVTGNLTGNVTGTVSSLSNHSIDNLSDVAITGAADGDFLRYNGANWINDPVNLTTDTVGDYVAKLASGTGITITNNSGEGATPNISIDSTVVTTADTGTVTSTMIANGTIVNADIDASAAIDKTKISGTAITAADTSTVTNTMLAGSIALTKLLSDTTTALGLGTIELGHATDTTIARSAAGVITVEGVEVVTISSSQTLTNKTISAGSNTISDLTNSNLSGTAGITNANLANSSITINGQSISLGSSATITAAAETLTGTTLNSTVVGSSLTSVGTLSSLTVSGNITASGLILDGIEIDAATPSDTNVLKYSSALNKYIPGVASTVAALDDLTDVVITSATPNQVLKYDGYNWVNAVSPSSVEGTTYFSTIGNGTDSTFTITHGLSTRDVVVSFTETSSPYASFSTLWEATTLNAITVYFETPPASNAVRVSIYAAVSGVAITTDLDSLTDVSLGSLANGDFLIYNGSAWINNPATIQLTGHVTGSASFDGSANASITTTIAANSVTLGTDTTGDYVASLVAGTGVSLSNNSGEGATPTVAIGQAVGTADNPTFAGATLGNLRFGVTTNNRIDTISGGIDIYPASKVSAGTTVGDDVNIYAGEANSDDGFGTTQGGTLYLNGGWGADSSTSNEGGNVVINAGRAFGPGAITNADGDIYIGDLYAETVYISRPNKATTVNGNLTVSGDTNVGNLFVNSVKIDPSGASVGQSLIYSGGNFIPGSPSTNTRDVEIRIAMNVE